MTTLVDDLGISAERLFSPLMDMRCVAEHLGQSPSLTGRTFLATFHSDTRDLDSICICDLAFANSAGACLSRIPPAIASESTKEGNCPEGCQENLREVFNLCSVLLRGNRKVRIIFDDMFEQSDGMLQHLPEAFSNCEFSWEVLSVTLGDYEPGTLVVGRAK